MSPLKIVSSEHGVAMSCANADRIPAGVESSRKLGMICQHYGWPGITRTLEGDILVSASERIRHVDPFGRPVVSRSTDGGRTWDAPQVISDSLSDDRDTAVNTLPDGTIVASWFTSRSWSGCSWTLPEWAEIEKQVGGDTLRALTQGWLRRSTDGARAWEDRVYPTIVGQHAGPSVLSNGHMIYCGPLPDEIGTVVATLSEDGGRTWSVIGRIPSPMVRDEKTGREHTMLNENHALEIAPGRLLVVFRGGTVNWNIHFTRSDDGGRTWSEPEDTGVFGFPSYLIRLEAGPILCVYGDRHEPQAIRGVLSYDDGQTWDFENGLLIREFPYKADMGYPVALEVSPNEVLCAYYSIPDPDISRKAAEDPAQMESGASGSFDEEWERLREVDNGILTTRIRLNKA